MPRLGFIIDLEKCYGCDACSAACQNEHLWPKDVPFNIVAKESEETPGRLFAPLLCMHCDEPGCLAQCDVGALELDHDGVVVLDLNLCTGCGACVIACPFGAMAQTDTSDDGRLRSMMTSNQRALSAKWDIRRKRNIPAKCELCPSRRAEGRLPACVAICPTGAFIYGDLDDPGSTINREMSGGHVVSMGTHTESPRVFYRLPPDMDKQRAQQQISKRKKR